MEVYFEKLVEIGLNVKAYLEGKSSGTASQTAVQSKNVEVCLASKDSKWFQDVPPKNSVHCVFKNFKKSFFEILSLKSVSNVKASCPFSVWTLGIFKNV